MSVTSETTGVAGWFFYVLAGCFALGLGLVPVWILLGWLQMPLLAGLIFCGFYIALWGVVLVHLVPRRDGTRRTRVGG